MNSFVQKNEIISFKQQLTKKIIKIQVDLTKLFSWYLIFSTFELNQLNKT